jgi:hypothetical protein
MTGPSGAVTDVRYDPRGLPEVVTEPETSGGQRPATTYGYNGMGQLASVERSGHTQGTNYQYNVFGDRIKVTSPQGQIDGYFTSFELDKLGRTRRMIQPAARPQSDPNAEPRQKETTEVIHDFDRAGNLKYVTQPTGTGQTIKVKYTYWENNLIETESDPSDPNPDAPGSGCSMTTTKRAARPCARTA